MIKKIPYADHDEWLKIRKNYIGGSDAGAILGMNPYSSPYSVWAEKTGKIPGFEGNTITKVGSYLEEFVAQMFEDETGKKVRRCNFTIVNDDYPWACANIDREVVGEDALLEIKTTNSYVNVKKFRNGEYPEQWYAQMTHYLAVTGKQKAYLAVLSECREFRIFELQRDELEITALMEAEKAFWEKVQNDTPPAPDGSEACSDAIKYIFSSDDGGTVDLFGMEGVFELRSLLSQQVKDLKTQIDELDNQIKLQMGVASKATCDKWTVSWKTQKTAGLDREAIKRDYPGFDPAMYQGSSRVFRVTEKRQKT